MDPYNSNTWQLSNYPQSFDDFEIPSNPSDVQDDDQKGGMKRLLEKNTVADEPDGVDHFITTIPPELRHTILESGCFSNLSTMSRVNRYWLSLINQKLSQIFRNYEGFKCLIEELKQRSRPSSNEDQLPAGIIHNYNGLYSKYSCKKINLELSDRREKLCKKEIDFKTVLKLNDLLNKIEFIGFCNDLLNPELVNSAAIALRSKIDSNDKTIIDPESNTNYLALIKDNHLEMDDFERVDAVFNYLTNFINSNTKLLENYTNLDLYTTSRPPEIRLLTNVTTLSIGDTFNELFELINLTKLIVHELHRFSNKTYELTNLKSLYLNSFDYRATIEISKEIGNLIHLKKLTLEHCTLESPLEEIGNLTNLKKLTLTDCNLQSLPEEIGNLSKLKVLNLDRNKLTTLPEKLWSLAALTELIVRNNRLISIPSDISNLTNLQNFSFFNENLVSLPPARVWDSLPNLSLHCEPSDWGFDNFDKGINQKNRNEQKRLNQLIEQGEQYLKEEDMLVEVVGKLRELEHFVIKDRLEDLIEEVPSMEEDVDFENKLMELKNLIITNGHEDLIEELPPDDDF